MKIYTLLLVSILATILLGCDDFLEEPPSKSSAIVASTVEDLEAILNNYFEFGEEPAREIITSTDDYALITELIDGYPLAFSTLQAQHGTWDVDFVTTDFRPYWNIEWEKVFKANLILQELPDVAGTEEQKRQLEAEAHFIRAYSYFQMANIFCLPFNDVNRGELGLPIKEMTSFEESLVRATLEETWAFMEADLMKALELNTDLGTANGLNKIWRANTAAVNGFAARFYLAQNDYEKAQNYAQIALDVHGTLRDYNTEMRFSSLPREITVVIDGETQNVSLDLPFTVDDPVGIFEWGETYYYRFLVNGSKNYYPSPELLGLYDQTYDLRYKFHVVEDHSYSLGAVDPAYSYPGYLFFSDKDIMSGPSVPEMLLIKAECQVRRGDFANGLATVNILRTSRMDASAPDNVINLDAVSQAEALTKVLEERRREMPFVHRWYDIRRYNNNGDASDDVVLTRTFYPYNETLILTSEAPINYTLEKDSRRFARPLPTPDIIASDGALEQNKY